jgi:hypothetical protein
MEILIFYFGIVPCIDLIVASALEIVLSREMAVRLHPYSLVKGECLLSDIVRHDVSGPVIPFEGAIFFKV